jgi:hypothetical protein
LPAAAVQSFFVYAAEVEKRECKSLTSIDALSSGGTNADPVLAQVTPGTAIAKHIMLTFATTDT